MGKDLKGKELGKGLSQRKDGLYSARFVNSQKIRVVKYFKTVPEARNWLEDARYEDKHNNVLVPSGMTVDEWFRFWLDVYMAERAPNTIRNKQERYENSIKPIIGAIKLCDIKPLHCQKVLNEMSPVYAGSTIEQAYTLMKSMFKAAVTNELIIKQPMEGVTLSKPAKDASSISFMTVDEQSAFLDAICSCHYQRQFKLLLQTGVRIGELIGLTWSDIDFDNQSITVCKTMSYLSDKKVWDVRQTKTKAGYRILPMTKKTFDILYEAYEERSARKQSESLTTKEFIDWKSGKVRTLDMRGLVFLHWKTDEPIKTTAYDSCMYGMCDKAGIPRFSVHDLRHTYATRAIERGVPPKTLQRLLGHASLKTTMDRYVHTTEESLIEAVKRFEEGEHMA